MPITHPFGPLYNTDSRVLILGSFPSVKSREANFFYGHPQNRFWRVIASVLSCPVPVSIEESVKCSLPTASRCGIPWRAAISQAPRTLPLKIRWLTTCLRFLKPRTYAFSASMGRSQKKFTANTAGANMTSPAAPCRQPARLTPSSPWNVSALSGRRRCSRSCAPDMRFAGYPSSSIC